jgi:hypothetical protein
MNKILFYKLQRALRQKRTLAHIKVEHGEIKFTHINYLLKIWRNNQTLIRKNQLTIQHVEIHQPGMHSTPDSLFVIYA